LIPLQQIYVQVSATATSTNSNATPPFPVLLIHGYLSDASVWKKWEDLLKKDNISVFPLTFKQSDDNVVQLPSMQKNYPVKRLV
jgi:pimeloyl-ACP methyl ester carboxylesterase